MVPVAELPNLFDRFLKAGSYLRNWSANTVHAYEHGWKHLAQWLATSPDADAADAVAGRFPRKAQIESFTLTLRAKGLSPAGCNVHLRTLSSFLSWLRDEGLTEERVRVKLLHAPRHPRVIFSDADVRAILKSPPRNAARARLLTLLTLLVETGVRIDEALGLRIGDCDLDALALTVLGKGSKKRRVPISIDLRKVLWRHLRARERAKVPGELVFATRSGLRVSLCNTQRDIKILCDELGIKGPRRSPHTFRHYFAVSYIRAGGDIYRLSRILGHTSVKTTEIYLRSMGLDALSERHQQLSPLGRLR
jgi:integrase/recombinase XerD